MLNQIVFWTKNTIELEMIERKSNKVVIWVINKYNNLLPSLVTIIMC